MSDLVKVVIADDEQMALDGITRLVESFEGYQVVGKALNGKQAYNLIKENDADILLTDIKMPIFDGLQLMKTIEEEGLSVTVIVISAYDDSSYLRQAIRNPVVFDYLLKPIFPDDLKTTLLEAVSFHNKNHTKLTNEYSEDEMMTPVVAYAIKIIKEEYSDTELNLNMVADKLNITPNYLSKCFKRDVGESFTNYLNGYRIDKAKDLLKDISIKINDLAYSVGFADAGYFDKVFKLKVGLSPLKYRQSIVG